MINNEDLMMGFRRARRHHRTGWGTQTRVTRPIVLVPLPAEPPLEIITETDVLDDSVYAQCERCCESDYAAMLLDGICNRCEREERQEWTDTIDAILRAESAMRGDRVLVRR